MKLHTAIAAAALTLLTGLACAQTAASAAASMPRVDQREANQQKRIAAGAADGSLTAKETQHLEKQQARIETAKEAAEADGKVTKKERAHLAHMQNKANRDIHHQRHDKQHAASAPASK